MQRARTINDLLSKWHRWAQAPARVDDSLMRDLDAMICQMSHGQRVALAFRARNVATAAVWSSPRIPPEAMQAATDALAALLEADPSRWYGPRVIQFNMRGNRIGESNPRAELTDHEVNLLLELREEKNADGSYRFSLQQLAEKFEVAKSTVQDICSGRRRGQMPAKVRVV